MALTYKSEYRIEIKFIVLLVFKCVRLIIYEYQKNLSTRRKKIFFIENLAKFVM